MTGCVQRRASKLSAFWWWCRFSATASTDVLTRLPRQRGYPAHRSYILLSTGLQVRIAMSTSPKQP